MTKTIQLTWGEARQSFPAGTTPLNAMLQFAQRPANPKTVLAAVVDGKLRELTEPLTQGGEFTPVTMQEEEGRRIYERSLRFVMLLAIRRRYPGQQVRIEYSAGHGVYVRLPGMVLSTDVAAQIQQEMEAIVAADLPFEKKDWQLRDAIRYFAAQGEGDKVALLTHRPFPTFTMYGLDGMWEYFYGTMVPSTGYVPHFSIHMLDKGVVLMMPSSAEPDKPAPYHPMPRLLGVFAESVAWCDILGVNNAADMNLLLSQGRFRDFVRVNEALHDKAIAAMADDICRQGKQVVLIAGPSSSGKTTFTGRLAVHLRVLGHHPLVVSLDNYYINRDEIQLEADGSLDLEHIRTLDLPLLRQQITQLLQGDAVEVPRFNFTTGKRATEGTVMRLGPGQPILIEGIHGLNPLLREGMPREKVHTIFVSALTCLNLDDHNRIRTTDVRLLRRAVRDHQFRGTSPRDTLAMWPSVRRGEEKWIFPFQEQADSIFNTALHYELPVLKRFAYDALKEIRPEEDTYLSSRRLLKTLHYITPVEEALLDEIPPLSLLREFIGGCTLHEGE